MLGPRGPLGTGSRPALTPGFPARSQRPGDKPQPAAPPTQPPTHPQPPAQLKVRLSCGAEHNASERRDPVTSRSGTGTHTHTHALAHAHTHIYVCACTHTHTCTHFADVFKNCNLKVVPFICSNILCKMNYKFYSISIQIM